MSASDQNAEFNNILNNGEDVGWPATKAKDLDGRQLLLDSDADSHFTADTDDRLDLALAGTDLFRWVGTVATPVNGIDFIAEATGTRTRLVATGDTNIGIEFRPKGTGTNVWADQNGNEIVILAAGTASAVNEVTFTNAATGNSPQIAATGETNVSLEIRSKGTGDVILADDSGNQILIAADVASAVNEITITNAAAAAEPSIAVTGGDTDISLILTTKGTGVVATAANAIIGSSSVAPDGTLHIHTATAGAVTANSLADDLVIEGAGNTGISILTPNNQVARINFGDPQDDDVGSISYGHSSNQLEFFVNTLTGLQINSIGAVTKPNQPSFLAHNSSTDVQQTGNGTQATVDFDTEIFDQNADFASDTFTAPVTGRYFFATAVEAVDLSSASAAFLRIVTSNRTYTNTISGPDDGTYSATLSVVADMDAADTVTVTFQVDGMAGDTADISGSSTLSTYFSGCLLA